ncbi:MAG TPA: LysR substrate-binding domain-containing protein [Miltoncostaeales bacterium]|jgi:DNA-binding transcriptional LysR family regulator|nr:LysR substrate-binding domain-containing protein [Miltoncostaeales bacterium]
MRELRYLTAFVALAEERHFGRAAQRLGVSQPSLSEQIARLEDALGVQLLERGMRPIGLSAAGEDLLAGIAHPMRTITETVDRLRVGDPDRVLRLAVPRAPYRLHPPVRALVDDLRSQLPGWEVEVSELLGSSATDALREGLVDLVIAYAPVYGEELRFEPLFMDQPMVLMRTDHPLADNAEVPLAALDGMPLLTWSEDSAPGLMDAFFSSCGRYGVRPDVVEVAPTPGELAKELHRGRGVAIVAAAWADNALFGTELTVLPLRQPATVITGVVVWSESGRPTVVSALTSCLAQRRRTGNRGQD